MKFISKTVSIIMMVAGGVVAAGSITMLGVGTQNKYEGVGIGSLNFIPGSGSVSYSAFVDTMKLFIKTNEKYNPNIDASTKKAIDLANAVISTYNVLIAGAVLFSVSSLILIIGIIGFVLYKKNEGHR